MDFDFGSYFSSLRWHVMSFVNTNEIEQKAVYASASVFTAAILIAIAFIVASYIFYSREIIREGKEAKRVERGETLVRSPSFEDLGLNILFEDVSRRLTYEGIQEEATNNVGHADGDPDDSDDSDEEGGLETEAEVEDDNTGVPLSVSQEIDAPDLPRDMLAFLRSIKVFGYFEEPVFLELYKHSQTLLLKEGDYLFRNEDCDCNLYVVVQGTIRILVEEPATYASVAAEQLSAQKTPLHKKASSLLRRLQPTKPTGKRPALVDDDSDRLLIAEMKDGDAVSSLINVLRLLVHGEEQTAEQLAAFGPDRVTARAAVDTTLLKIPAAAFVRLSQEFPRVAAHMIQVIITRLHRVTFLTLTRFLGLNDEFLVEASPHDIVEATSTSAKGSLAQGKGSLASPSKPAATKVPLTTSKSRRESMESPGRSGRDSPSNEAQAAVGAGVDADGAGATGAAGASGSVREGSQSSTASGTPASSILGTQPGSSTPAAAAPASGSASSAQSSSVPSPSPRGAPPKIPTSALEVEIKLLSLLTGLSQSGVMELFVDDRLDPARGRNRLGIVGDLEIVYVEQGQLLVSEGDIDSGAFFVLRGELEVSVNKYEFGNNPVGSTTFLVRPGGMTGYLSLISHYPSLLSVRARTASVLGYVSPDTFSARLGSRDGRDAMAIARCIGRRLVATISPLAHQIDFALDWVHLNAGKTLFREGEDSTSLFVVLSGRLRAAVTRKDGKAENAGEYGQGESVGEFSVFTDTPYSSSVYAVRDAELVRMPQALIRVLALKIPKVALQVSRLTAARSLRQLQDLRHPRPKHNVRTVALLPVTSDVPLFSFAQNLCDSLNVIGASLLLTRESVLTRMGPRAFSKIGALMLSTWLDTQEEHHRIVLYAADPTVTQWTRRCVQHADLILLVGRAGHPQPTPTTLEQQLIRARSPARKELVLLHDESAPEPRSTYLWLQERPYIYASHHVRLASSEASDVLPSGPRSRGESANSSPASSSRSRRASFTTSTSEATPPASPTSASALPERSSARPQALLVSGGTASRREVVRPPPSTIYANSDTMRLARRLTGRTVGLVLGGGGARGLAHIGVLRALEECGVPVDTIGGTSIGACIGALYAKEGNSAKVEEDALRLASMMGNKLTMLLDLTYPLVSIFTGRGFNRIIRKVIGDTQIEDLWVPYVAVSTNLTNSRVEAHRYGSAWRYVRASMTLAGYLPPLSDKGCLLVDGGYCNNLPADVVRTLGADRIVAVDVSSAEDTSPVNYADSLSGWWQLVQRWNPFGVPSRVPTMNDIQARLAYVGSTAKLEEVKTMEGVLYVRPPIEKFSLLEWESAEQIVKVGYEHARPIIAKWVEEDLLVEAHSEPLRKYNRSERLPQAFPVIPALQLTPKASPSRRRQSRVLSF